MAQGEKGCALLISQKCDSIVIGKLPHVSAVAERRKCHEENRS